MMQQIEKILQTEQVSHYLREGILFCIVANQHEGFSISKTLLDALIDSKTALYLSGGSTPKVLYEQMAKEEKIIPGAVGMVDERFGPKFHEKSNEKMFQETGLLRYLQMRGVPFYPMLENRSRLETAESYDEKLRTLNATYQKSVAILGIGSDGHTAGVAGNRSDFTNPLFAPVQKTLLVSEFDDPTGPFKERVTMTFLALSMLDLLIVMAFGEEKKAAFDLVFADGSEEEIPARFFKRPEIAKKTLFITDQSV